MCVKSGFPSSCSIQSNHCLDDGSSHIANIHVSAVRGACPVRNFRMSLGIVIVRWSWSERGRHEEPAPDVFRPAV
jgi:hypothetical protein